MDARMRSLSSCVGRCLALLKRKQSPPTVICRRDFNVHRTSIARIGRTHYVRSYPTLLVQPDGSTITIRYHLPQRIIKLPVDISKLTEEEKMLHMGKRKPKQKVVFQEIEDDNFDVDEYSHLWKK